MSRLERWARWMLPRQEAEDVIADYRDIVADEELFRGLDRPRNVVKPLAQKKLYYTWLAVFAVAAACILAVGFSGTLLGFPFWMLLFDGGRGGPYYAPYVAALGAAAVLVWFRLRGHKTERLSRAVPVLLGVCLLYIAGVLLFCWVCSRDFEGFSNAWGTISTWIGPNTDVSRSFYLSKMAIGYAGVPLSIAGVIALVKARTGDRRWAAVYVLAMAAALAGILVIVQSYQIGPAFGYEDAFRQILLRCSAVAAVGLAGVGVALC